MKLFIVHGWTYNLDKWAELVKSLELAGHQPVLLKVPGLTAPSDKVWTIDDYVEWLKTQLDGQTKPAIIGHSNGGRIALAYDQKYPGKIGKLILIDSAGVAHADPARRAKLSALKAIAKVGKPLAKVPGVSRVFHRVIGANDYHNSPPNMKATMQNMLAADTDIDLAKTSVPTTLIWGSDDTQTPLADGQTMARQIPGAKISVVTGGRHAPMFTHTDQVAKLIIGALE